jgi:glycosyltransferase involved in cell wall biosynthesis
MLKNQKIAVVIPAYNVLKHLKDVIISIPDFVDKIIVVDDKCPQNSGKIVENLDRVTVIYHSKNQGVGGAVFSGYKEAIKQECDIVVKIDGDGQMDTAYLQNLITPLIDNKADYTKGNRFFDLTKLKTMPKMRLFGNSVLSFLVKAASGYWNIMDPTNGYTAITKKAIKLLEYRSIDKRYFFETSMLINLNIMNLVVKDVPIPAKYGDEESNLSIFKSAVEFPRKLLKGFLKRIFYRYFLYDFNMGSIYLILGLPMFLFGVIFGGYRWYLSAVYDIANPIGTVMLVALSTILGVQFLVGGVGVDMNNIPKKTAL